ncbi:SPW repeat domain-containing protein [Segeticoccus rhizosphaerae]|jgi:hypothetical protein|uniref:SPW repeat domain-containing protein n=1 Tax=Segeticoccus rhizosphaerae TaxID=1104777 RepID=UPI00139013B0|nr:SPW repeat protein [Ornithinicoccus soli]
MRRGIHPQDGLALLVGIYAFLSPIWTPTVGKATATMIVLGIITALAALTEIVKPDLMATEGLLVVLGVLFFIAPWVLTFRAEVMPMAWTAWVVGVVTFLIGASDLQITRRVHHKAVATH